MVHRATHCGMRTRTRATHTPMYRFPGHIIAYAEDTQLFTIAFEDGDLQARPHLRRDSPHICAGTHPTSASGYGGRQLLGANPFHRYSLYSMSEQCWRGAAAASYLRASRRSGFHSGRAHRRIGTGALGVGVITTPQGGSTHGAPTCRRWRCPTPTASSSGLRVVPTSSSPCRLSVLSGRLYPPASTSHPSGSRVSTVLWSVGLRCA
jgi:hypothetical protein